MFYYSYIVLKNKGLKMLVANLSKTDGINVGPKTTSVNIEAKQIIQ